MCQKKTVSHICEVRMNTDLPCVTEGAKLLRFSGQIVVSTVRDLAPVYEWLEIGTVTDAVGRINIYHLHLPR